MQRNHRGELERGSGMGCSRCPGQAFHFRRWPVTCPTLQRLHFAGIYVRLNTKLLSQLRDHLSLTVINRYLETGQIFLCYQARSPG